MIPQMELQAAGTAATPATAGTDAADDPVAARDFLDALGPGAKPHHGPRTVLGPTGKPGAKVAAKKDEDPDPVGAAPVMHTPQPDATKPTPAQAEQVGDALTPSAGVQTSTMALASGALAALPEGGDAAEVASSSGAEGLPPISATLQATGAATRPSVSSPPQIASDAAAPREGPETTDSGLPPNPDPAVFAAQHRAAVLTVPPLPIQAAALSITGAAQPASASNPAAPNEGPAGQTTAQALASPSNRAAGSDDMLIAAVVSSQQKGTPAVPSPRSEYSQAAAILIWQAGLGAEPEAAPAPVASAASDTAGQANLVLLTRAGAAAPAQMLQPDADLSAAAHGADAASDTPAVAASPPATLAGAIASLATVPGMAESPAAEGKMALPAPFHPLVASIRTHAALRSPAHTEPIGTELLLHPADLGRIRFALAGSGDQLTITVAADNPGTLQLLKSHAADLRAELAREGFGQASLSFTGPGSGGTQSHTGREQPASPVPVPDPTPADPTPIAPLQTPAPMAPPAGGGLDLRL